MFTSAVQAVRSLIEQGDFTDVLGSNPDSLTAAAADIILERIYLSLHLVDRIAGRTLDAEKRSQFMDELLNEVSENVAHVMLTDKSKSNRRNFEDLFVSRYQKRLQIYTPLPIAMGNNPGTLFGEAARGIANAHFPNDTGRATLMLSIEFPLLYAQLIETLEPAMRRAAGRATA